MSHLALAAGVPTPRWPGVLSQWTFQPVTVALLIAAVAVYFVLVVMAQHRMGWRWRTGRIAAFLCAVALTTVALLSPVERYGNVLFTVHMAQHVMLIMVVPVLLVLGMPESLLLHALDRRRRHRLIRILRSWPLRVISFPLLAFALYAGVVVGTHLSGFYETTITHPAARELEHVIYLVVGYLYWLPIIGREPIRWRLHHGLRLLLVLIAMPVDAFVGLALVSANHELFPALARTGRTWGPSLIHDIHDGGAVMWIGGDLIMAVIIITLLVPGWMRAERRVEARVDAEQRRQIAARRQLLRAERERGSGASH